MRSTKLANILALAAVFTVFLLFSLIDASPLPESTSIAIGGPKNVARKTKVCICTCETKSCKSHCCAASQEKSTLGALALRTFYGVEPDQTVRRDASTKDTSTSFAHGAVKAVKVLSPQLIEDTIETAQTTARHDGSATLALIEGKTAEHEPLPGHVANGRRACCPCNAIGLFCSYNCCAGNKGALGEFGDGSSVMISRALDGHAGPGAENQHELYSKRALPQGEEEHEVNARANTHSAHVLLAPRADDEKHQWRAKAASAVGALPHHIVLSRRCSRCRDFNL